jgi:hypothetical protein
MTTSSIKFAPLVPGLAAFSATCAPVLRAQTVDQTTNSKTLNNSGSASSSSRTAGNPANQPGTTATGSATASVTKDPNDTTTDKTATWKEAGIGFQNKSIPNFDYGDGVSILIGR